MPRITERAIKAIKPPTTGNLVIWDTELKGFGARMTAAGAVSFVLRYVFKGRERRYTIGRFPNLSATAARDMAQSLSGDIAKGIDPLEVRQSGFRAGTISSLCDRYLREYVAVHNKPRTEEEVTGIVNRIIKPKVGSLAVGALTSSDIAKMHHSLKDTPRQANHTISVISKILNLAELWKLRPEGSNPCRKIRRFKENKRERFLSVDEMIALGNTLSKVEAEETELRQCVDALRLLALTGCRLSEICTLRWEDVDYINHAFRIREAKAGSRTHAIGAPVAAYLKSMQERICSEWVVPASRDPEKPLPATTLERAWTRIRAAAGLCDARIHDLRHTVGTYAGATGANAFLIRDMLGHKTVAMTGRYVNQDADPLRKLSNEVENKISSAIGLMANAQKGEVVQLNKRKG